jgi:hypothetical protein
MIPELERRGVVVVWEPVAETPTPSASTAAAPHTPMHYMIYGVIVGLISILTMYILKRRLKREKERKD